MPCELIGKMFDWENISYMVALSTFCSNQDYKGQILTGDLKDMLEFSESIGHILKFKEYYYKEQIRGILQGWGRYMGQPCFYLLHTMREDLKMNILSLYVKIIFLQYHFKKMNSWSISTMKKAIEFSIEWNL